MKHVKKEAHETISEWQEMKLFLEKYTVDAPSLASETHSTSIFAALITLVLMQISGSTLCLHDLNLNAVKCVKWGHFPLHTRQPHGKMAEKAALEDLHFPLFLWVLVLWIHCSAKAAFVSMDARITGFCLRTLFAGSWCWPLVLLTYNGPVLFMFVWGHFWGNHMKAWERLWKWNTEREFDLNFLTGFFYYNVVILVEKQMSYFHPSIIIRL